MKYATCHVTTKTIVDANIQLCSTIDSNQTDLGPYCLLYRMPKYVSRWGSRQQFCRKWWVQMVILFYLFFFLFFFFFFWGGGVEFVIPGNYSPR